MAGSMRWPEVNFSLPRSILRWSSSQGAAMWSRTSWILPQNILGWWWDPESDFSIVDSVMWSFITAFESVALVSMLAFYFVFYGCTI